MRYDGAGVDGVVWFGRTGRSAADSDIDLLIVASGLPAGRPAIQDRLRDADGAVDARLTARRLIRDGRRYWELKPDYPPGEIFEL
jgi:hypothetical protein